MASGSGGDVRGRKDAYFIGQNGVLEVAKPGVLSNDLGLEGETLTSLLDSDVSHGHLILNRDGSFNYAPAPDYLGPDSFSYQAKSGDMISEVVTVTIQVTKTETGGEKPNGPRRLDLSIYALDDGYLIEPGAGIDIQNQDGVNQMVALSHAEGESKAAKFLVEIYNRGSVADTFVFKASATSQGWNLRYFDAVRQGNDITGEITSEKGWTMGSVNPNNSSYVRLEAKLDPSLPNVSSGSALITATSTSEETAIDAVQATFGFQRIAKLQYSLDQGNNWLDAPPSESGQAIVAPTKSIIGLRAVRFNQSMPWPFEPDLKPAWEYDNSWFVGEAVWLDCGTPSNQLKPIQAECGNVLIANLKVVETFRLSLRPSKVYVPLGGGALGQVSLGARLTNSSGEPVVGATVRFTAKFEDGAAAGEMTAPGANQDRAITDANGIATVTLTSGTVSGAVAIKAILMESNRDTAVTQGQEVVFGGIETEAAEPVDF